MSIKSLTFILLLIITAHSAFSDELAPPIAQSVLDCDSSFHNKNSQSSLDLLFLFCLDNALNDPESNWEAHFYDHTFKKYCLYELWNYQVVIQKEYLECIQNQSLYNSALPYIYQGQKK
jgi:hypothetical protein